MGEEDFLTTSVPFDSTVEQTIIAIKKGAYLLKCGRRGKPKFCPFRLSMDEKFLIWYTRQKEKQLRLSSVTKIITGQRTVNFRRHLQPDREQQSFSLVYANGECSLDLICKDKVQADSWLIGLGAVISRCHHSRQFSSLRGRKGIQSCVNSPAGYLRRKHNLGLLEDATELSQVRSLCGSPSLSLSERCLSDGLSYSSDSFYSSESNLSKIQNVTNIITLNSPKKQSDNFKKWELNYVGTECPKNESHRFVVPSYGSRRLEKKDILKDVMIWGEGVLGGIIGGTVDSSHSHNKTQVDALLPKLLESAMMLDVQNISLGGKHAAIGTKRGEVFCWGEGKGGRLGHKVDMDVSCPKLVECLNGVLVQSVSCGEFQTCALTKSGEIYTWGDNNQGAHLVGETRNRSLWFPHKLSGPLNGLCISKVACGQWHTAVVSTSGQLFTYGDGTFGVLGHGNLMNVSQPKEVESLRGLKVKSVACGTWHMGAIVEIMVDRCKSNAIGGKLFTWGDGDKGRLGHADGERKLLPACVAQLVDFDFVQVSCGRMLTVGLTSSGNVYTMGSAHGQLGNPQAKDESITAVEGKLKDEFVKEISSGSFHIAVLTSGGSVYTWGKNANGQLGLGDTQDRYSPTFVDTLRDREVESVVCGSNMTAALCLHKSISVSDQSACSGCRMPFGFRRKKHNCYNCGLHFCSVCSSKKAINASLTPNKSKPSRVCDTCYNHLQKISHSGRLFKQENHSPRILLSLLAVLSDKITEEKGEVTPTRGQLFTNKQSCNAENKPGERKIFENREENQRHLEPASSMSSELQRWGQVSRPIQFEMYCNEKSTALAPLSNNQMSSHSPILQNVSLESNLIVPIGSTEDQDLYESNKMLTKEVQRLRAEAKCLEKRCQIGNQKIKECQLKIEEAWSLAREEAAKCKAAKEIIKALAVRLHALSEKVNTGREAKDGVDANVPQFTNIKNSPKNEDVGVNHPIFIDTNNPPKVKLPKDGKVDSLCSSPIVFSDKLKSLYGNGRDLLCHENSSRSVEDSHLARTEPQQKASKLEWVEQYEPGIYITFTTLTSGQKGLKRVRFSRKRFTEKEAERWWEENQVVVYQKYGMEEYSNSNQNQMRS